MARNRSDDTWLTTLQETGEACWFLGAGDDIGTAVDAIRAHADTLAVDAVAITLTRTGTHLHVTVPAAGPGRRGPRFDGGRR